jgi:hypothetical protein
MDSELSRESERELIEEL